MMKKFFAMAMLLLGLVACGEQNKQTPDTPTFTKDGIVGIWELTSVSTKATVGSETVFVYVQFESSGSFTLYGAGHNSREITKARRRMGAIVETPAIYTDMTAEENLRQQYLILGLPSYDGIPELLKLVGLENTGRKKAKHFSLGMKQRLGIAIALAGDPDFLVLDEPVNGLDPQGIVEMRELILKLNRERRITVLISSHILDELSRLATHYGIIDHGRMVKELSAEELDAACRKCVHMEVTDTFQSVCNIMIILQHTHVLLPSQVVIPWRSSQTVLIKARV